ncbi:MAG: hypothetical protein AB4062_04330 [Crocosphaera sp.]
MKIESVKKAIINYLKNPRTWINQNMLDNKFDYDNIRLRYIQKGEFIRHSGVEGNIYEVVFKEKCEYGQCDCKDIYKCELEKKYDHYGKQIWECPYENDSYFESCKDNNGYYAVKMLIMINEKYEVITDRLIKTGYRSEYITEEQEYIL